MYYITIIITIMCANDKGKLFKSAKPNSNVFIQQRHEICINGENL